MVADTGSKSLAAAFLSAVRCFICFMGFWSAQIVVFSGNGRVFMVSRSVSRQLQFYFLALNLHFLWS